MVRGRTWYSPKHPAFDTVCTYHESHLQMAMSRHTRYSGIFTTLVLRGRGPGHSYSSEAPAWDEGAGVHVKPCVTEGLDYLFQK